MIVVLSQSRDTGLQALPGVPMLPFSMQGSGVDMSALRQLILPHKRKTHDLSSDLTGGKGPLRIYK